MLLLLFFFNSHFLFFSEILKSTISYFGKNINTNTNSNTTENSYYS